MNGEKPRRKRKRRRVEEPLTEELLEELLVSPDPAQFARKHRIAEKGLSEYLNELLESKGLARIDVIREAGLNETFGYQIFVGQRNPSRDKVLQIAFAMHLDLREANRLLRIAGVSDLYCKTAATPLSFSASIGAIRCAEPTKSCIVFASRLSVSRLKSMHIAISAECATASAGMGRRAPRRPSLFW